MKNLQSLISKLKEFNSERSWESFHDPKNLTMLLASEVGELLAELRWIPNQEADKALESGERRLRVEREIGDVFISLLLLCSRLGIDPIQAAEKKLELNQAKYPAEKFQGNFE